MALNPISYIKLKYMQLVQILKEISFFEILFMCLFIFLIIVAIFGFKWIYIPASIAVYFLYKEIVGDIQDSIILNSRGKNK